MNDQLALSFDASPASPPVTEASGIEIIVALEVGDRVQVLQSDLLTEDVGRVGTVQPFRESMLRGRIKVLLDGDRLCRFFQRDQLDMVPIPPPELAIGDTITTTHGKATVTHFGAVGKAALVFASYHGSNPIPHLTRSVLAVEKGDCSGTAAASSDQVLVGSCSGTVPESSDQVLVGSDSRIVQLQQERQQILASGELAPAGAWLNKGKVSRKRFIQCYWKADQPIFRSKETGQPVKRQYIGELNSPEHRAALEAVDRRNRVRVIDRELKRLEKERSH